MVRLTDLPEIDAAHLLSKPLPKVAEEAWTRPPALSNARVAIVTTAGLALRGDARFDLRDCGYRVIPGDVKADELVMSHTSVNFDRTGYQLDLNVAFPIDRLNELAAQGHIGSVAAWHYGFMGAYHEPAAYEESAREVGARLRADGVDVVLLVPI